MGKIVDKGYNPGCANYMFFPIAQQRMQLTSRAKHGDNGEKASNSCSSYGTIQLK